MGTDGKFSHVSLRTNQKLQETFRLPPSFPSFLVLERESMLERRQFSTDRAGSAAILPTKGRASEPPCRLPALNVAGVVTKHSDAIPFPRQCTEGGF